MLQNVFHILLISLIAITWGFPFLIYQQKKSGTIFSLDSETIIFSFFAGVCLIALFSSWISLFIPLNFYVIPVITIIILLFLARWVYKNPGLYRLNLSKPGVLSTLFFLVAALHFIFLGSNHPVMEDTDLYHVQVIRWNQEYGTVPGLSNLYLRYGFFSNWFHLIAVLSFPFKHQNFLFLNIATSIWFAFFLLNKIRLHILIDDAPHRILSVFYFLVLGYIFIEWDLFRGNASSTSYDFIVTVLALLVLSLITENFLFKKDFFTNHIIVILFSVAAMTFKLTGIPLFFICLIYIVLSKGVSRILTPTFLLLLLFVSPWMIKNYFQTGYIFFPYTTMGQVIHPDWQTPPTMVTRFTDYIHLGNKYINQSIPGEIWQDPSTLNSSWVSVWIRNITMTDKFIFLLTVCSFLASFFIPAFRKNFNLKCIYYACILIIPFWFFSSPDPRFIYGFLCFIAFIPISFLLKDFFKKPFMNAGFLLGMISIFIYTIGKSKNFNPEYFVQPPKIYVPPVASVQINGKTYYVPEKINNNWNKRCYDAPLPCIYQFNPYLEQRGKDLENGFKMQPVRDKDFILNYNY